MNNVFEELDKAPNTIIADSLVITKSKLERYENILVSISGGADSDIMLDIISKFNKDKNINYVFFDTGLEYQATKDHLKFLEEKYSIEIERVRTKKPIPISCKEYGQPFLNKRVSNNIQRLQSHNFKWENDDFETLYKKYPNCKIALKWWCNAWEKSKNGYDSQYNISNNKWLKEFMIVNPPDFKISDKCCDWSKKSPAKKYKKENDIELSLVGVRKAEGGARATRYKSCFTADVKGVDEFRPIFWYKNDDKDAYEESYEVTHSKCYTEYGLKRTGCAGCPFGRDFEQELEVIEKHEPKLYGAVNKIFANSYEYTRKYKEFAKRMEESSK